MVLEDFWGVRVSRRSGGNRKYSLPHFIIEKPAIYLLLFEATYQFE